MTFSVTFHPGRPVPGHVVRAERPEPDCDDEVAIICASQMLAEVQGSRFELNGFGLYPWPLDVSYDMSAFMEQVDDLMTALRCRAWGYVDLYTQGVEASLEFTHDEDMVRIICRSTTGWTPDPSVEVIELSALLGMLACLVEDVARGLGMVDERILLRSPFDAWTRGGQ